MRLTFLGKESQPNQSPTLYASDRDSYIVQDGLSLIKRCWHGSTSATMRRWSKCRLGS